jgi:hypothetical protein
MDKHKDVSEEVRKTMESMEHLSRVHPRPGFRQRVLARATPGPRGAVISMTQQLQWAAVGLLLLLNTAIAYHRLSGGGVRHQLENALMERYGLGETYQSYYGIK